ncbi:MAG: hypothetical protein IPK80_01180 [Nannocystis sp.]|nr:hypothetical protein [Nannocystis sp.]
MPIIAPGAEDLRRFLALHTDGLHRELGDASLAASAFAAAELLLRRNEVTPALIAALVDHLGLSDRAVYRLPTLSVDDGAELLRRLAPAPALADPECRRRLARAARPPRRSAGK